MNRAKKRMDGEDVFGNKIVVSDPMRIEETNGRDRKNSARSDLDPMISTNRKQAEFHFNNYKQFPNDVSKATPPITNNLTKFKFPKVPNVESVKSCPKSYAQVLNNNNNNDNNNNSDEKVQLSNNYKEAKSDCYFENNRSKSTSETQTRSPYFKTPSPRFAKSVNEDSEEYHIYPSGSTAHASYKTADELSEEEFENSLFRPIQSANSSKEKENKTPVELHITGLDRHLGLNANKSLLMNLFRGHVDVQNITVFMKATGNVSAKVRVGSLLDAQYAISQMQGRPVGTKRIHISLPKNVASQFHIIRSNVMQLLSEIPRSPMPVFVFRDRYETRYQSSLSISDLNKMKDICFISDEERKGRFIVSTIDDVAESQSSQVDFPYCVIHSNKPDNGLTDQETTLPFVYISLKLLTLRIHSLLQTHEGKLPLPSLPDCYKAQFGPLNPNPQGVPLEHLVSCIPGVEILQLQASVKYLKWRPSSGEGSEDPVKCVSPMLMPCMSAFTKELVELLKNTPRCLLQFSQFIPEYHRRYGKQCRVADYGFTKLIDLLESLPHIVQIIGACQVKMITLAHRVQARRFTYDLFKVLKNIPNKTVEVSELPELYEKVYNKSWDPCNYGVCELEDLLEETPAASIAVYKNEFGQTFISVPKKEQTEEEVEQTKRFSKEVLELLRKVPSCSMYFHKFIPSYHHYFGRQCRVSKFGFFKLIEVFESIPDVVTLHTDATGERIVSLTTEEKLKVLTERLTNTINSTSEHRLLLSQLSSAYNYLYNTAFDVKDFGFTSLEELITKLSHSIKLERTARGLELTFITPQDIKLINLKIRRVLFQARGQMVIGNFYRTYSEIFAEASPNLQKLARYPFTVYQFVKNSRHESVIQLTGLHLFANDMYQLLYEHGGRILLSAVEQLYRHKFKKQIQPTQFGFSCLQDLLEALPETLLVENNRYVSLVRKLEEAGYQMPTKLRSSRSLSDYDAQSSTSEDESTWQKQYKAKRHNKENYDLWGSQCIFPSTEDLLATIHGPNSHIKPPDPSELPSPIKLIQKSYMEPTSTSQDSEQSGNFKILSQFN